MNDKEFLGKRRDRAIATVLSYKEREVDPFLTKETASGLRKIFLDQINELVDLAFDMIASPTHIEFNEAFVEALDRYFVEE